MRQTVSLLQIKAARQLLGWSQSRLAAEVGVSLVSIKRFESAGNPPVSQDIAERVERALTKYIDFLPENGQGAGVRLKKAES